jgi:3',5'-cyclic AMP phosphodiesterase CpdA
MNGFVMAHVSDLHLPFEPRLTPLQRLSKRQLSAWSWRRRRALHRPEILDALVADMRASAVDHIVVTGDITNFALPDEFRRAADWLRALAPPGQLSVVPGNHDALVPVPHAGGLHAWREWMPDAAGWPSLRRFGAVTLIGLDSALPTAPLLARGALGHAQLARLERVLAEEGGAGQLRVVALHHPPAEGAVSRRKALADRAALRDVLQRAGAELVLHGHARDARLDTVAGPRAPIACLCVPSSSALPSRFDEGARWHRLSFGSDARPASVEVAVRRWSTPDAAFVDAGTYELLLPRQEP